MARAQKRRRLGVYSLGLATSRQTRAMLAAFGWDIRSGPISNDLDAIGVWGAGPVAQRGVRAARRRALPLLYLEDGFLRSPEPREGPSFGLTIDHQRPFFDASGPSDLEDLLNEPPPPVTAQMKERLEMFLHSGLSKYNSAQGPVRDAAGYVLIVDQVRGDASIRMGGANTQTFKAMLEHAQRNFPDRPILIRRHPASRSDSEAHFTVADLSDHIRFMKPQVSVEAAITGARAIYCVTSQLGFEAVLRGKIPVVFGQPFYAGWGVTQDQNPVGRRRTRHSALSLFQRVMCDYSKWYDPARGAQTDLGGAMQMLEAARKAHHLKKERNVMVAARLWKRANLAQFLPKMRFVDDGAKAAETASQLGGRVVVWASREPEDLAATCMRENVQLLRVEDGFLRSKGLGAELVNTSSYCFDRRGIYYDPSRVNDLDELICNSAGLPKAALDRAAKLRSKIVANALSKYNLALDGWTPPKDKRVVLVPGQVEDDASIQKGCSGIRTNRALLEAARLANPEAYIAYKPHPDVEAGLRAGRLEDDPFSDEVLENVSPIAAIEGADEVWTMTSLMGFEALMRGKKVTCAGMPFYAGWGLTHDLLPRPEHRSIGASLDGLVHATLIDYPYYCDPKSGLPCSPELLVDRFAEGVFPAQTTRLRALSKLQGALASYAWLWR